MFLVWQGTRLFRPNGIQAVRVEIVFYIEQLGSLA
jgi:hypothetical protein